MKCDRFESSNLSSLEELYLDLSTNTATKHTFSGLNRLKTLYLECEQIEQGCLMDLGEKLVCLDLNYVENLIWKEIEKLANLECLSIHLDNQEEVEHFERLRLPKLKCLLLETYTEVRLPNLKHVQLEYLKIGTPKIEKKQICEFVRSISQPHLAALVLNIYGISRFILPRECFKSFTQLVHFSIRGSSEVTNDFYAHLIQNSKAYSYKYGRQIIVILNSLNYWLFSLRFFYFFLFKRFLFTRASKK
jgi:hypothetical protein